MTPDVPTVLNGVVQSLMIDVAPEVRSQYGALNLQLMSALLMMITQEFDRSSARLLVENQELVQIFREAGTVVTDEALGSELERAAAWRPRELGVSALQQANKGLRGLLVRLHEHVEMIHDPAAGALDDRIWAELAESTRRRQLDLAIA